MKFFRRSAIVVLVPVMLIAYAWAFGALWYDGPGKAFAVLIALAIPAALVFVKPWRMKLAVFATWFALVIAWWLTLAPSNQGDW